MIAKLSVNASDFEIFKKACEIADIKVKDFITLGNELKVVVSLRSPDKLYILGQYVYQIKSGELKPIHDTQKKKPNKKK